MTGKIHEDLKSWLFENDNRGSLVRNLAKLRVSLGPTVDRFWATDGGSAKWSNLPQSLQTRLNSMIENGSWVEVPSQIVLGAGDDYILRSPSSVSWVLENYPNLDAALKLTEEAGGLGRIKVVDIFFLG